MSYDFQTTSHAKWILCGEHAVLRGHPAIVFPLTQYSLRLSYQQSNTPCQISFQGEGEDWQVVIRGVLERGCALVDKCSDSLTGVFDIQNKIPLGVGLGGSAALCVAFANWFSWKQWIKPDAVNEFARELENIFHRNSSGLDIAGANADCGLIYQHNKDLLPLNPVWQPKFGLSYSDQIGVTSQAVKRVQDYHQRDPKTAKKIDCAMAESVKLAIEALQIPEEQGLNKLIKAINQAKVCFHQWGLAEGKINQHMIALSNAGALATKPTGSGDGGYVLSLWSDPVEQNGILFLS